MYHYHHRNKDDCPATTNHSDSKCPKETDQETTRGKARKTTTTTTTTTIKDNNVTRAEHTNPIGDPKPGQDTKDPMPDNLPPASETNNNPVECSRSEPAWPSPQPHAKRHERLEPRRILLQ